MGATGGVASGAPDRCVMILGMHRSGTSALAGSLREAGLYMGDVLDGGFALNPKGLQEPESIIFMHEDLLRANGGAWHDPPAQIEWRRLHSSVRRLFIESRRGHGVWGFKEPRTLLVAEAWIEDLPDWTGVGIFRDPREVAVSIHRRNGFPVEKGLRLWQTYNARLLDLHRRHGVALMEFTTSASQMRAGIARLAAHAGLHPPEHPAFYDATIPRSTPADAAIDLPADIAALLEALRTAAA